jgi:uncharacterized protein YjbI with pentapeptide repeats
MATKRELKQRWEVEPGATICQRIIDFERPLQIGHGRSSDELFRLLDGIPYREEVPNGRDFRGADFAGSVEMDLSQTDFTYSVNASDFLQCNLTEARFDEVSYESVSFAHTLYGASFRSAKLRSCHIMNTDARNCCFDGANIYHMNFKNTDLSGSSFRSANCKGACFFGANLIGCDFRGANLEEAVFENTKIDKTTDFRGASLINAFHDDHFDKQGNLVGRGVDLRTATFDATTKFGKDPAAFPIELLEQACRIATTEYGPEGARVCAVIKQIRDKLGLQYWENWWQDLVAELDQQQRELYEEVMDKTYRSLL